MSYGQDLLKRYIDIMCPFKYVENFRPDWLGGMELDFYFSARKIAIEFNGDQHYIDTRDFGNSESQRRRDYVKNRLCKEKGIYLKILDASDLEYSRLRSRLGAIFKKEAIKNPRTLHQLKLLNKECIQYRKLLIKNWDSPTAHRNYSKIRKQIISSKVNGVE